MPLDKIEIADFKLKPIQSTSQLLFVERYGFSVTSIRRSRLRDTLLEHYGKPVHTGKRLERVLDNGKSVKAFFTDGSHVVGEILIGADGIHSAVRRQLFPHSKIRYSGQTCWRGVAHLTLDAPYERACVETWGKKYRFGLSVISEDEVYWFAVAKAPRGGKDDRSHLKEKLQKMYADFSEPIPTVLSATPAEHIIRNDITDLQPIAEWHKGRICLIGDAAHATTPNMGQGGGQAVEDAWFISKLLGEEKDYKLAFQAFQNKRQKKVAQVVKTSWQIGKVAHMSFGQGFRNFLLRNTPRSLAEKRMLDLYSIDY